MSAQLDALAALQPDVGAFAAAFLDAFPGSAIASGRRSIDEQAWADAVLCVDGRNKLGHPYDATILATYVPSTVRAAMATVCAEHPEADTPTLGTLFASCLGQFTDEDLSHFSLHLSGHAVDLAPVHDGAGQLVQDFSDRVAWCEAWIAKFIACGKGEPARCRLLQREAGLARLHCQLVPVTT